MRKFAVIAATALLAVPAFAQQPPAAAGTPPTEEQRMAAFKANDKNNDGKLDKTEYKALLDQLGFGDLFDMLFAQRDADKDGFVSAEEYKDPVQ